MINFPDCFAKRLNSFEKYTSNLAYIADKHSFTKAKQKYEHAVTTYFSYKSEIFSTGSVTVEGSNTSPSKEFKYLYFINPCMWEKTSPTTVKHFNYIFSQKIYYMLDYTRILSYVHDMLYQTTKSPYKMCMNLFNYCDCNLQEVWVHNKLKNNNLLITFKPKYDKYRIYCFTLYSPSVYTDIHDFIIKNCKNIFADLCY